MITDALRFSFTIKQRFTTTNKPYCTNCETTKKNTNVRQAALQCTKRHLTMVGRCLLRRGSITSKLVTFPPRQLSVMYLSNIRIAEELVEGLQKLKPNLGRRERIEYKATRVRCSRCSPESHSIGQQSYPGCILVGEIDPWQVVVGHRDAVGNVLAT